MQAFIDKNKRKGYYIYMISDIFNNTSGGEKEGAVEKLISQSTPTIDFFLMVALSVFMAAFGLLIDSSAIVIGAMLIAPVLYPLLSSSMGIVMFNKKLIRLSLTTLLKSIAVGIGAAFIVGIFFGSKEALLANEIMSRTSPSLIDAAIAVVAGFAASFALVKPKLSETLPGIAISVSLVPPLAVTGLGLAFFDGAIIRGSLLLFFVNVIGIMFASVFVFSAMNFYIKRGAATQAIKKEEKEEHMI
ncbi:TIGR00341 family protein [Candidatus Wolfebacteria bacterium]|nr:MAG: TIGR00341 family protein [Candidatus Wolfebacteria bacterium]